GRDEFVEVPGSHPVSGWRYVVVKHFQGKVLSFDRFSADQPAYWDGTIGAPVAECIPSISISFRERPWQGLPPAHEVCDPVCSCGYRLVHDVADLVPYVRKLADFRESIVAEQASAEVREGAGLDPAADLQQSVGLVSVMGAGNAAR